MDSTKKIITREKLKEFLSLEELKSKIVGFTSGAFDILHVGHVQYLEKARQQCDILLVAVNSDFSIKQYKSDKRPVIKQENRARLLAGLECVDYVFIFDELNNNTNIEILRPNIYFKAADYSKEKLSSASIVESYGGKVSLLDFTPGCSSTAIINSILELYNPAHTEEVMSPAKDKRPAVFLDRDGTINVHVEYLHELDKFKMIDGAVEALKKFQQAGYYLIVVTNQPGVGLGYYTKEDLYIINKEMLKACSKEGVLIDKIYFCPHSKSEGCSCRKPETGMIKRAVSEMNIDLAGSYMLGDTTTDILCGKKAGCKTVLLQTGNAGKDGLCDVQPDLIASNLLDAAVKIVSNPGIFE